MATDLLRQASAVTGLTAARMYAWRFLKGVYHKTDEHHVFLMSSGLSFSLLFCIVPLGLVLFAVLGLILERTSIISEVGTWIDRAVPYPEFGAYIKALVFARAEEFRLYKNVAGIIGMIGLLLAASGLFSSMRTILDDIFGVRANAAIYKVKVRDVGLVVLVLAYFMLSMAIVPLSDILFGLASRVSFLQWLNLEFFERLSVHLFTILLILGGYWIMYFTVPRQSIPVRVVFVSALSATVLWFTAKELFGLYILHAANLRKIYGTYVVMVMLGLWIYYSSLVFIIGAVIGQVYKELRHRAATGTLLETPTAAE